MKKVNELLTYAVTLDLLIAVYYDNADRITESAKLENKVLL